MNIQFEAQKIHSQFGTTEMANYQIQLLAERYAKLYHESELKKLRVTDVSGRSEQLKCQCKKAQFTRTVDADFNCLCGRCGKAL